MYEVIINEDINSFKEEVTKYVKSGRELAGGMCISRLGYCQAIYKKNIRTRKENPDVDPTLVEFKEYWNSIESFPSVSYITSAIEEEWAKLLKEVKGDLTLVEKALSNYLDEISKRSKGTDYYNHRFELHKFLKQSNGARKFINYGF